MAHAQGKPSGDGAVTFLDRLFRRDEYKPPPDEDDEDTVLDNEDEDGDA